MVKVRDSLGLPQFTFKQLVQMLRHWKDKRKEVT